MIFNILAATGLFKRTVTVYGAPNETVTITNSRYTYTVQLDSAGESATIEVMRGTYTVTGTISRDALWNGRTVTVNSSTTDITAYPPGAIYWFGREIMTVSADYRAYGSYSHTGSATKYADNIALKLRTRGDAGSTSWASCWVTHDVTMYNYINALTGELTGATSYNARMGYGSHSGSLSQAVTTAGVYSQDITDVRESTDVGVTIHVTTIGAVYCSANLTVRALWLDIDPYIPQTEILAGSNTVDAALGTLRYSSGFASPGWKAPMEFTGYHEGLIGHNSDGFNCGLIPLGYFDFDGNSSKILVNCGWYCPSLTFASTGLRWAICTSSENKALYQTTDAVTNDQYQLASGVTYLRPYEVGGSSDVTFNFSVPGVQPFDNLYLFLWPNGTYTDVAHFNGTIISSLYYTEAEEEETTDE